MCGIGAFQIVGNECEPAQVARVLLRLLEKRGKDASGVAWHKDGQTYTHKAAIKGTDFAKQLDKDIGTTGIVHTRWATLGSPKNNDNNHPIDVGGVIGVHNGHCLNHDALIKECATYQRQAQVDSEAIFAMIAHGNAEMKLKERLAEVRGNAALLWLRSFDKAERLHAARLSNSPLVFGQTKRGSVVFASTKETLLETSKRCNLAFEYIHEMAEGTYVRVQDGVVGAMQKVKIQPAPVALPKHDYTKGSTWAQSFIDVKPLKDRNYQYTHPLNQSLRDQLDMQYGFGDYNRTYYSEGFNNERDGFDTLDQGA